MIICHGDEYVGRYHTQKHVRDDAKVCITETSDVRGCISSEKDVSKCEYYSERGARHCQSRNRWRSDNRNIHAARCAMSALVEYLANARRGLESSSRQGDRIASRQGAEELMNAVWEIGTLLYSTSGGQNPTFAPELKLFIAETADVLWQAEPGLARWLPHVTDRYPTSDGGHYPWLRARSAIEFLRELYRGTDGGEYADGLATNHFDEEIRFRSDQYNVGTPPSGVPGHHWWWWTP